MLRTDVKIIKEYVVHEEYKTIRFTVRTTLYDDSVQYWLDLIEIAKQDFPDLEFNEVESVVYGGMRYKRTRGIEFVLPESTNIPDGYIDGVIVEYTL